MDEVIGEKTTDKESLMNNDINKESKRDNLFNRLKSMFLSYFMGLLNDKLEKNILFDIIINFLSKIKNKKDI